MITKSRDNHRTMPFRLINEYANDDTGKKKQFVHSFFSSTTQSRQNRRVAV